MTFGADAVNGILNGAVQEFNNGKQEQRQHQDQPFNHGLRQLEG
jgi:hypothetical protein